MHPSQGEDSSHHAVTVARRHVRTEQRRDGAGGFDRVREFGGRGGCDHHFEGNQPGSLPPARHYPATGGGHPAPRDVTNRLGWRFGSPFGTLRERR
jgi:hypothetical protein